MRRHHPTIDPKIIINTTTTTASIDSSSYPSLPSLNPIDPYSSRYATHHAHPLPPSRPYPLSLRSSISLFTIGLLDSLRFKAIYDCLRIRTDLRSSILRNSILQFILIASIFGFESYTNHHHCTTTTSVLVNVLWLIPLTLTTIVWSGSISEQLLKPNHQGHRQDHYHPYFGRRDGRRIDLRVIFNDQIINPKNLGSFFIRENHHTKILIFLEYVLISNGFLFIPPTRLGFALSLMFCSIGNSFYCFDLVWTKRDHLSFEERLDSLESRWEYHLGFGLIMTLLTSINEHEMMVNFLIFTFLYPFFVILSTCSSFQNNHYTNPSSMDHKKSEDLTYQTIDLRSSIDPDSHSIRLPIFNLSRKIYSTYFKSFQHLSSSSRSLP